jgi:hypothetical protein
MEIKELKNYGVEINLMFQKIPGNHPETVKEAKKADLSYPLSNEQSNGAEDSQNAGTILFR